MVLMESLGLNPASTLVISFLTMFVGVILVYGLGRTAKKYASWMAAVISLISTLLLIDIMLPAVSTGVMAGPYTWIPNFLNIGLYADGLSYPIVLMISALGTITLFYCAIDKDIENAPAFYGNMMLFIAGMVGVVLSTNLIQFILFWEVMLLPSFLLISMFGVTTERKVSALKYFLYTHFGSAALFAGVFIIGFLTGTFDLYSAPSVSPLKPMLATVGFTALVGVAGLILIAFIVKMAIFPLHTWLPSAYYDAPIPVTLLLSSAMTKTAAYGIARILILFLAPEIVDLRLGLMIFAVITMYYGGILALAQDNLKSMLAYSSMSQMGYILFGLSAVTLYGALGGVFHIINHGIAMTIMWISCGIVLKQAGTFEFSKLRGLGAKMPVTAMCAVIAGLGLAGTPPLSGFQSEWLIFYGGVNYSPILVLLAIIATALTAGYYLWAIRRIFFGPTKPNLKNVKDAPLKTRSLMLLLALFVVVFGIIPSIVLNVINPVLSTVLTG
nr:NADH-quinone oxidoreductase subunit M [Candidatus Njordarchaeota archaeon]